MKLVIYIVLITYISIIYSCQQKKYDYEKDYCGWVISGLSESTINILGNQHLFNIDSGRATITIRPNDLMFQKYRLGDTICTCDKHLFENRRHNR